MIPDSAAHVGTSIYGTAIARVYADGGVCHVNPSPCGGTFAAVFCDDQNTEIGYIQGHFTPAEVGLVVVGNNLSEFAAVTLGLEPMPDGWSGTVFTDSQVTITRFRNLGNPKKCKDVPAVVLDRARRTWERMGSVGFVLLDGHPTMAQLVAGKGKRGNPVSLWNKKCDRLCTEEAAKLHYLVNSPPAPAGSPAPGIA